MTTRPTHRDQAKADRHAALLHEAARLFAERGFTSVSLEELGAAVGVTGPAVYRHFANKQAMLGAILVGVSERLLAGGRDVIDTHADAYTRLDGLVRFHVDFALTDADVIRVQDRDLESLSDDDRHAVRRLQREYVEVWVGVLQELLPDSSPAELRVRAHACFGLINSTPHSVRGLKDAPREAAVRGILESMARTALLS
ncbi:TetR family transcriptional regulator BkaR [Microbacterium aoyamense]|uniref:TetR family transcriptional regulator BkaR n=1 Tax=Microbacterium aoyamense TaxID=344166 RepID=A0ABP5B6H9_9MICO|nr:TetR/AcrR family transcriptional regulator [Microbacterium aoyamense]